MKFIILINSYTISQTNKESMEEREKTKGNTKIIGMKSKQKNVPLEEKQFTPMTMMNTAPPIFDSFVPSPGVSLIEGGRTKIGPKYSTGTTLTDRGLTLPISESAGTIRLSKNEYLQLTKANNLNRQNMNTTDSVKMLLSTDSLKNTVDYADPAKNWLFKINEIKEANVKEKNIKKNLNPSNNKLGIKINNTKFYETLLEISEDDDLKSELPLVNEKQNFKSDVAYDFKKTLVDEFNQDILHSRDWGKNTAFLAQNAIPSVLPKPSNKLFNKTLGIKSKFPRERGILSHIQKSRSSNRSNGF